MWIFGVHYVLGTRFSVGVWVLCACGVVVGVEVRVSGGSECEYDQSSTSYRRDC